jgi:hypothetical protein
MTKPSTLDRILSNHLKNRKENITHLQPKSETLLYILRYSLALEVIKTKVIGARLLLLN